MIRGILTVGAWTMASRLLGFVRDILIAALLGAGPVADAFFVANKLPNLFRRLFGEGAFNAAFVPAFAGLLAAEGREAARGFAEQVISVMAFWLVGIAIVAELLMAPLMTVLAPRFVDVPGKLELAVELGRIAFPYMPLICLVALFSGILNALNKFAAAAASQVVYNVTSIAFMLALAPVLPTPGHALALGVSASGVFQLALVAWAVRASGMRLSVPRPRLTPRMRALMRKMLPGLLGAGVVQINSLVDVFIAALLPPGTVSVLYYADRVNQLPLGIIGTAVGTALLPTLSRQVLGGQPAEAVGTLNRAIEFALLLTLPAAAALAAIAGPIVSTLFQHGAFGADSARMTALALGAYATGLPAFVLVKVLVPAFFARGDTALPVRTGIAAVVLNVALNLAFLAPFAYLGPALASSLSSWFNVAALAVVLHRRRQMVIDAALRRRAPRMLAATGAMVAVLLLAMRFLLPVIDAVPIAGMRVAGLSVLIALGGLAYALAAEFLGAFSVREVARRLLRRRAPVPAG